jgi:type IV pilus assembly protein PilB
MSIKIKRLGDLLVENLLISSDQLKEALQLQSKTNKKLGQILVDEGFLNDKQIIEVLEFQLGIPHVNLDNYMIDSAAPKLISERLARKHNIIPLKIDKNRLIVAMADPLNIFAIDDVKLATGFEVEPVIGTYQDIEVAIDKYYNKIGAEKALEEFSETFTTEFTMEQDSEEMLENIANAPVVKLVYGVIAQAAKLKASDIHIEPIDKQVRIRYRIDGELMEFMNPDKSSHSAIVTRIKIMGRMDIAEKRIPQDGRVEMQIDGRDIDLRISILPTVHGEKIVIRLLDRSGEVLRKEQLGFTKENLDMFNRIIKNPHGIILVTGPTGSGKTTTLYAALTELNTIDKNIITIEDPVEYRLSGVNQSQVNVKAGLTFAGGLRSILRQDPDIVMVGEIRDHETAQIAVRAAITGHLVLSTLHTNDTASTIARLVDMGIEPYLLASSVVGIIAQRLVRKICTNCKTSYKASKAEAEALGIPEGSVLYKGEGCNLCNQSGISGRMAIHEVMPITKKIRETIENKATTDVINEVAVAQGMKSLRHNCLELALAGTITAEEVLKMTYNIE